jgi:peptide/nickel transport system permease protein
VAATGATPATPLASSQEVEAEHGVPAPRRHPRIDQLRRTWYFLSRNTLALVGLAILLLLVGIAVYSFFYPAPVDGLQYYCGTYTGNGGNTTNSTGCGAALTVCTYPSGSPPPAANCYPVDPFEPSFIAPTVNFAHFQAGPLPLGSMTVQPSGSSFFNILSGIVKGAPWSLGISIGIVGSGALIGLMLGAIAGYRGGYTDEVIMRGTDIFLSIPAILLALVILAVFAPVFPTLDERIGVLMGAFVVTWWPFYTRIVRGQVLVTREQKFVEASRAGGASTGRIVRKHIIPNSLFPVFVQMSLDVGTVPLLLGAIIFLGFHIWPNVYFPEWGTMSAQSVGVIPELLTLCTLDPSCTIPWWQILFPSLMVFLFAISVNFLSDGLRDSLDPRLRR